MQPTRVYGDVIAKNQLRAPSNYDYNSNESKINRFIARARPLMQSDWNGHIELTGECLLGLALFQVSTLNTIEKKMHVAWIKSKKVEVHRIADFKDTKVYLFRSSDTVTIPDLMLKHMQYRGLEHYVAEYTLVSQLLNKILINEFNESMKDNWIPTFSPPLGMIGSLLNKKLKISLTGPSFEISGGYSMKVDTIGQWLLLLLLERVRRQVSAGIGLRTLIYCVCWSARLIQENDFERLHLSAAVIKIWLLQNTCQDCVYKDLWNIRADFKHHFNIADSFSEYFILPDMKTSIIIGECPSKNNVKISKTRGFLRTFGNHSFVTSPYSSVKLPVKIGVPENGPIVTFQMTGRQTATVLTMLDLHARVLCARRDWKQCKRAFSACLRERRANNGTSLLSVMQQIVEDLLALSRLSLHLKCAVSHFALLIFRGSLSAEMLSAYGRSRESARNFIVRHCFISGPTPDTVAYAETMYHNYAYGSIEERRAIIEYTIEDCEHRYEFCAEGIDLMDRWNIPGTACKDELTDNCGGATLVFSSSRGQSSDDNNTNEGEEEVKFEKVSFPSDRNDPGVAISESGAPLKQIELDMLDLKIDADTPEKQETMSSLNNDSIYSDALDYFFTEYGKDDPSPSSESVISPDEASSVTYNMPKLERN